MKSCLEVFKPCVRAIAVLAGLGWSTSVPAVADEARSRMQEALNEEVLSSPFDPGDVEKANAYAEQAMKQNLKPVQVAPTYWQPGWTCSNLVSYRYYRYRDYRNCIYYHRYYGRYW
jgi:hypothetical protein